MSKHVSKAEAGLTCTSGIRNQRKAELTTHLEQMWVCFQLKNARLPSGRHFGLYTALNIALIWNELYRSDHRNVTFSTRLQRND